jgi:hypothetical protein
MKERKKAANTTATTTLAPIIILVPSAADEESSCYALRGTCCPPAQKPGQQSPAALFRCRLCTGRIFSRFGFSDEKNPFNVYKQLVGLPGFAWVFYCQLYLSFALFLCLSISLYLCLIPLSLPNLT